MDGLNVGVANSIYFFPPFGGFGFEGVFGAEGGVYPSKYTFGAEGGTNPLIGSGTLGGFRPVVFFSAMMFPL